MKYIISTVTDEIRSTWTPEEFCRHYFWWTAEETFDDVAAWADPAGTWQIILETEDEAEARAEWKRVKAETGLNEVDTMNGFMRWFETVYKFERDNEDESDPNQIELLEWHAEGFECGSEANEEDDEDEGSAE